MAMENTANDDTRQDHATGIGNSEHYCLVYELAGGDTTPVLETRERSDGDAEYLIEDKGRTHWITGEVYSERLTVGPIHIGTKNDRQQHLVIREGRIPVQWIAARGMKAGRPEFFVNDGAEQ